MNLTKISSHGTISVSLIIDFIVNDPLIISHRENYLALLIPILVECYRVFKRVNGTPCLTRFDIDISSSNSS